MPHCPKCDAPIEARAPDEVYAQLLATKGSCRAARARRCARARAPTSISSPRPRAPGSRDAIVDGAIVAHRRSASRSTRRRSTRSISVVHEGKLAVARARGLRPRARAAAHGARQAAPAEGRRDGSSRRRAPARSCGTGVPELDPRWFSFNTKQGQLRRVRGHRRPGRSGCARGRGRAGPVPHLRGLAPRARSARVRLAGERYHEVSGRSVDGAPRRGRARALASRAIARSSPRRLSRELVRRLDFVEEVGLGYLGARSPRDHPLRRRDAAPPPRRAARQRAHRRALRARRADHRPAPARHRSACSPTCARSSTRAAPCSWSSTTRTRSAPPITSSISAPRAVATAGASSHRARRRRSSRIPPRPPRAPSRRSSRSPRPGPASALRRPGSSSRARASTTCAIDELRLPVGRMTVVAGVSGSGKSTLVRQVLYPALRKALGLVTPEPGQHDSLKLPKTITRALAVDQSPDRPHAALGACDLPRRLGRDARALRRVARRADPRVFAPRASRSTRPPEAAAPSARGRASSRTRCPSSPTSDRPARPAAAALRARDARRALPRPLDRRRAPPDRRRGRARLRRAPEDRASRSRS